MFLKRERTLLVFLMLRFENRDISLRCKELCVLRQNMNFQIEVLRKSD